MESSSNQRTEIEIFNELEELCSTPGFIHVLAFLCSLDNFIYTTEDEGLTRESLSQQFDTTRLTRTEFSSLLGLMCKNFTEVTPLSFNETQLLAQRTSELLAELHSSFLGFINLPESLISNSEEESDHNGFIREAIFYAGEGVYKNQYRDIAKIRYKNDIQWIINNKNFNYQDVSNVIQGIENLQIDKLNAGIRNKAEFVSESHLKFYEFRIPEVRKYCDLDDSTILSIVNAFSSTPNEGMEDFKSVDDFNYKNAFPILKLDNDLFVLFQGYSIWESQYESPFFWFNNDRNYRAIASKNRGEFTESFTAARLERVFGSRNVYTNIDMFKGKNKVAEIDVLVIHADTAIVIQAKSKKLTIEARKGNSNKLKKDFQESIQDSYKQAFECASHLNNNSIKLKDINGECVSLNREMKSIYPMCVVSDYYPALAFQARQFLKYEQSEIIYPPYVMDIFLIDLMAEFLESPLFFLDYIKKRANLKETLLSHHELVILGTYLSRNLSNLNSLDLITCLDDMSTDLELALLARREGEDCPAVPPGVLTLFNSSYVGKIISGVERSETSALLDLGFYLLSLSGDTIHRLNEAIDLIIKKFRENGIHRTLKSSSPEQDIGLTIQCSDYPIELVRKKLVEKCTKDKQLAGANEWHGVCFSADGKNFRFSVHNYEQIKDTGSTTSQDQSFTDLQQNTKQERYNFLNSMKSRGKPSKIGRNQACPCGSGKKFKKCCNYRL